MHRLLLKKGQGRENYQKRKGGFPKKDELGQKKPPT